MGGKGGAAGAGRNEEVSYSGEHADVLLQASHRPKALHHSLPLSQWNVRILGPVIQALVSAVLD